MVNARLICQLEKNRCIPLFQSGFRKGRSPSTISSPWKAKLETLLFGGTILSLFSLTSRRHMIVLGAMGFLALYIVTGLDAIYLVSYKTF
ncbi:hypothetical protein TNCV_2540101 [Trichonephila clavipes]|nr:hypothetical protein TNCV_2540101 [Trichonephila clavipes]